MNTRNWFAMAVLVAALSGSAYAQQGGATAPTAPRPSGATAALADGKIAVIDTSQFADKILELRSKADTVNKKYEARFKELEQMKTQMDTLQADIQRQQSVAAPDKLRTMQEQYQTIATNFKRRGEDLQNEYNREAETAIRPVRDKLRDFVRDYAAKRNIVLILDLPGSSQAGTIAYLNPAIDVTDDFIGEYNRANPVPGATAAPARPAGGR
jgi:Skp family chaperone for outer membrane proteins